jgi:hypothetical protein
MVLLEIELRPCPWRWEALDLKGEFFEKCYDYISNLDSCKKLNIKL